jgi:hypothetical protein
MKIERSKTYTTKEVAAYLSHRIGVQITSGYVSTLIREAAPFPTDSIGKYRIPGKFAVWMATMLVQSPGYHSKLRPSFGEWLDRSHHRRPKRREISASDSVPMVIKRPPQKQTTTVSEGNEYLIEKLDKLEKRLNEIEVYAKVDGNRSNLQPLPSPHPLRKKISKAIASWCFDRSDYIDYRTTWTEFYQRFWDKVGPPPRSWYQLQLEYEHKLDWFEVNGLLGLLGEVMPEILQEMAFKYPINTNKNQQELGL